MADSENRSARRSLLARFRLWSRRAKRLTLSRLQWNSGLLPGSFDPPWLEPTVLNRDHPLRKKITESFGWMFREWKDRKVRIFRQPTRTSKPKKTLALAAGRSKLTNRVRSWPSHRTRAYRSTRASNTSQFLSMRPTTAQTQMSELTSTLQYCERILDC